MDKLFVLDKIDWLIIIFFFNFIISNICRWTNFFGLVNFVLDLIY